MFWISVGDNKLEKHLQSAVSNAKEISGQILTSVRASQYYAIMS